MIRFFFLAILKHVVLRVLRARFEARGVLQERYLRQETYRLLTRINIVSCFAQLAFLLVKLSYALSKQTTDAWFWSCISASVAFVLAELYIARRLPEIVRAGNFNMSLNENDESDWLFVHVVSSANRKVGGRLRFTEDALKDGAAVQGAPRTDTLRRLFKLSMPDKWLLLGATASLMIGAVAQTSLPHFTGM